MRVMSSALCVEVPGGRELAHKVSLSETTDAPVNLIPSWMKLLPSVYRMRSGSFKGTSDRSDLSPWSW